MQSSRNPDRVHVVQRPQNDEGRPRSGGSEIARTLALINDKLKRSEAERYELLAELREYRKALSELEDKTEASEKAFLTLEHKIQTRDKLETDMTERQARFEKTLKETEEKLVKTVAGQALLGQKIKEVSDQGTALTVRIDESAAAQSRLNIQLEKVADDKSRMLRKVDRLEEVIQETQDALKARAMVLLTDQSAAAQGALPQIPAWGANDAADAAEADQPWWRRSVRMQSVGMGAMVAAALLLGWTINQVQQPDIPQIAVLEGGGLARLNFSENRWEPIDPDAPGARVAPQDVPAVTPAPGDIEPSAGTQSDTMNDGALVEEVQDDSALLTSQEDQALLDAMEEDADAIAAQLNALEPGSAVSEAIDDTPPARTAGDEALVEDLDESAFVQPADIVQAIEAERDPRPLTERMSPDKSLPGPVKAIENQAFAGLGAAQHDLAAIYTAGHGGVPQNFEKAAFWFREASENNVGNARYNLGVLYHQGLGVERDLGRALYWYREAAKLNHPEAQYNLGIAHIEGIGTDYDPLLAAAYFERSANQGIMEAAYNLGLIYENGLLGETRPEEALLWYKIAADQGSPDAKQALQTLAGSMKLSETDVDNLIAKLQAAHVSAKGRQAGPVPASTAD